jgi:hypothetical protein
MLGAPFTAVADRATGLWPGAAAKPSAAGLNVIARASRDRRRYHRS